MIRLDIEMVYRIGMCLDWRVSKGLPLILAGVWLWFNELMIGDRRFVQLHAVDPKETWRQIWTVTACWDRDHDEFLQAFIAGDTEALKRDWVMLKLMKDEWTQPYKNPNLEQSLAMIQKVDSPLKYEMGEIISVRIHNPAANKSVD